MTKTLVFERAGMKLSDMNDVGTGRIRTALHLKDGQEIYLELIAIRKNKHTQSWAQFERTGFVDSCYRMEDGQIAQDYIMYHMSDELRHFEWNLDNILKLVNSIGGDFDEVRIVDPSEYRVFKPEGHNRCNFGG